MLEADLEELYLTVARGPLVISIFLGMWGGVTLLLRHLNVDYLSVLSTSKFGHKPTANSSHLIVVSFVLFSTATFLLYLVRAFAIGPHVAIGLFHLLLGLAVLILPPTWTFNCSFVVEMLHFIISPGTDVHFTEVFVADAITSLAKVLSDAGVATLLLFTCWTDMVVVPRTFKVLLAAFLSWVPYWLRIRQCEIQYKYEVEHRRKRLHALNIGKYVSAFPLVVLSAMEVLEHSGSYEKKILGRLNALAALVNTGYSFLWDVWMDWGLAEPGAKWGLRKTMLIDSAWPYYAAILIDLVLRCLWVLKYVAPSLQFTDVVLVLELIEVLRRSMWSVFRLEWEVIQARDDRGYDEKLARLEHSDTLNVQNV